MDPISDLIERLAQSLQRSVAVDDSDLQLVAHSTHFGDADAARLRSLANRRMDGPVRDATFAAGFHQWTKPRRGRALGAHGHEYDRMSFPLRTREGLIGVMWVILKEGDLSDDEMDRCLGVAAQVEELLAEQHAHESEAERVTEELLRAAVSADSAVRAEALEGMADAGIAPCGRELCAYVFRIRGIDDPIPAGDVRSTVRRALRQSTEAMTGVPAAVAFTEDGVFALVAAAPDEDPAARRRAAQRVVAEMKRLDPSLGRRVRAGIGTVVDDPAAIVTSFQRAVTALHTADRDGESVVAWELRPLDALIDAVVGPEALEGSVPPVLLSLTDETSDEILRTVECFLDEAGSVARVSARLHLHRTTVYYRLRLFEKETGLSLDDGRDRLLLHLWLTVRDRVRLT